MTKRISQMLLLALFIATSVGFAQAQIRGVQFTAPFAFTVYDQQFPAGTYSFAQENPNTKLFVRSKKGKDGAFATTNLPSKGLFGVADSPWLIFHRYGDTYFLAEIWSHKIGVELPVGKEERRLIDSGAEKLDVRVNVRAK